ncbi:N-acetylmuramoyl-L-alanine amidase [bacterium A37T11]|nr:N-acetylmuramoyl-L-alanine amidase [bacterium A37T11]
MIKTPSPAAYALLLLAALSSSCASKKPYATSNKIYQQQVKVIAAEISKPPLPLTDTLPAEKASEWVGTVNFGMRRPNYVVIHHTAQDSLGQTLKTFTISRTQVSAHYVIGKDGKVYHMLSDYLRAWHAGNSKWGSITDLNSVSLGIEMDNNGTEPYTEVQLNSLLNLLDTIKLNYKIPADNFIGHGDIAPGRKVDPGVNFPWKKLAEKGFGIWYSDSLQTPPPAFDPMDGLLIIGYDISRPQDAIKAFKRHYLPDVAQDAEWTDYALSVLYNLYIKKKTALL